MERCLASGHVTIIWDRAAFGPGTEVFHLAETRRTTNQNGESPRRPRRRHKGGSIVLTILKVLGTLFLIGCTTGAILACFAATYIKTVIIPQDYVDASAYSMNLSSTIYYTDSTTGATKELRTLHGEENRVKVNYEEIPKDLVNALVSIEDERFWTHHGVDWRRSGGACRRPPGAGGAPDV